MNSVDHTFVYDTSAGIPAVIKEDSVYYIREPNGSLVTRVSSSNTSYYHFDQLGSTRLLTDGSGNVTDEYAYDAYGSLLSHNRRAGSVDQPYQYVGELGYYTHYQEPEVRLLQLGVRFYDAEVGGFTQVDPARYAPYVYADDNPILMIDPAGLWAAPRTPIDEGGCAENRKRCQDRAFARFDRCKNRCVTSGGAYDAAVCMIGCMPTLIWGKEAYGLCLTACGLVGGVAIVIDFNSCAKVLESEKNSCEDAYDDCVRRHSSHGRGPR